MGTDIFGPSTIATWVQNIIYVLVLVFLIWQISLLRKQVKKQEDAIRLQAEAMKQSDYLRCQIDFTETLRILLASQTHATVYDSLARGGSQFVNWTTYSGDDRKVYAYLEMVYELFERVFWVKKVGTIDAKEWRLWEVWFEDFARHPLLADVYRDNLGMFDGDFEAFVRSKLPTPIAEPVA